MDVSKEVESFIQGGGFGMGHLGSGHLGRRDGEVESTCLALAYQLELHSQMWLTI